MHSFEIASGKFKLEEQNGEWATELVHVPFLNNLTCRFIFDDGFIHDEDKYDYYHAINNILHINKDYLLEVSSYAFQYYRDITEQLNPHDGFIHIDSEQSIWKHVNFCPNLMVNRSEEDNQIYICLGVIVTGTRSMVYNWFSKTVNF